MRITSSFYHRSQEPWVFNLKEVGQVEIVFRIAKDSLDFANIHWLDSQLGMAEDMGSKNLVKMTKAGSTQLHDYYSVRLSNKTRRFKYVFELNENENGNTYWMNSKGEDVNMNGLLRPSDPFYCEFANIDNDIKVPDWFKETHWYQIFPDRFNRVGEQENYVSWDIEIPRGHEFYGGNLDGIIAKLEYIKSLGFNGIYFTPIFEAKTSHRYETHDYLKIDPILGDSEKFQTLINEAHKLGIKIMLDGVFNHIGYHSPQFQDVIKNKESSKYKDWFIIHDYSVLTNDLGSYRKNGGFRKNYPYETFAFVPEMPRLDTDNPEVREYIGKVIDKWTKMGIDGWRLDVSFEPSYDFWRWFNKRAKDINKDLVIIGEVWWDSIKWLQNGIWDGVMNYIVRQVILDYFISDMGDEAKYEFINKYNTYAFMYTPNQQWGMFNLLSSHDVERFYTTVEKNENLFKGAQKLLFALPGSTSTYYGEENGTEGKHDPDNRRPMNWDKEPIYKEFFNELVELRKTMYPKGTHDDRMVASKDGNVIIISNGHISIQIDGHNVEVKKTNKK